MTNITFAVLIGLLPAAAFSLILFIKKKSGPAALLCVTIAIFLTVGITLDSPASTVPPNELLRLCRLYLSGKNSSLPEGFVTADASVYDRLFKAEPKLADVCGAERNDPALAECRRRLRSAAPLCADRQAAYMTLAEIEFNLGHTGNAEAALGGAFSFIPVYRDTEPYIFSSAFAAFVQDYISRQNARFENLVSLPTRDGEFSLQGDLVYTTGEPVTLALSQSLPGDDLYLLLKGRRRYIIALDGKNVVLPADIKNGEYTLILTDGINAVTSPRLFYAVSSSGFGKIALGDYIFSACTADAGIVEGMVSLGGWLRLNGLKINEKKATFEFTSATVLYDTASPLRGGALTVTPSSVPVSSDSSPFVFSAAVTSGSVRLTDITVTLYPDRMELVQNGNGGILQDALSYLISGSRVSADIRGFIPNGRLFEPYKDTFPPVLDITATEDGSYLIITAMTEKGCFVNVDGNNTTAESGIFLYRTAAVDSLHVITAEDEAGNRTLRFFRFEKEKPRPTTFSLYSSAPLLFAALAVSVNTTFLTFIAADAEIRRAAVKNKRRLFVTAAVIGLSAAVFSIIYTVSETAKIDSPSFYQTAISAPQTAYEIIRGRNIAVFASAVLILGSLISLAVGSKNKKHNR